jgi:hypothetical protein
MRVEWASCSAQRDHTNQMIVLHVALGPMELPLGHACFAQVASTNPFQAQKAAFHAHLPTCRYGALCELFNRLASLAVFFLARLESDAMPHLQRQNQVTITQ